MLNAVVKTPQRNAASTWNTNRTGATKMNANSIGSVMPVMIEVRAAVSITPATALRREGSALKVIASAAAGRPKSMIGNSDAMKRPAVGIAREVARRFAMQDLARRRHRVRAELVEERRIENVMQSERDQ